MTSPLWSTDDPGDASPERLMEFMAGEDVLLDRHLFVYDLRASRAHVEGLERIDVLSGPEAEALLEALDRLRREFESGSFELDDRFEDCHSAIEWWLTEKLGATGEKVHTGRSRNDQVLVALRLYIRDRLEMLKSAARRAAGAALGRAERDDVPMPGYTHLQRAVPSSTGTWFAAFAEAFIDDALLAEQTQTWIDANPLGTAAGYGVNLPLDREYTTEALGFERMQVNPIYAQNSRGTFELQAIVALAQMLLDVRRLAWDMSLFTTREFAFVELPDDYVTGSSIMPNKRNPDVVELLRGTVSRPLGALTELQSLLSLPSGYQRDLQHTKRALIEGFENGLAAAAVAADLLDELILRPERMEEAHEPEMFATDRTIERTREGVPFREAYRQIKEELAEASGDQTPDPAESLEARVSPGAPGNLQLQQLRERLEELD